MVARKAFNRKTKEWYVLVGVNPRHIAILLNTPPFFEFDPRTLDHFAVVEAKEQFPEYFSIAEQRINAQKKPDCDPPFTTGFTAYCLGALPDESPNETAKTV